MRELALEDGAFLEIAAEILRQGGSFQFRAHGSSMAPFIRGGDLLTVGPVDPAALQIGDVVLFRTHQDRIITHRVLRKSAQEGGWTLVTQGDAHLTPDRPVPGERVLGRVVRIQRGPGGYRPDRGVWQLVARLWMRLLPLRRAQAWLVGGAKGVALRKLDSLQSLGAYRRLAWRTVGARARIGPAGASDAAGLVRLFGAETLPGMSQPVGLLARHVAEESGLALVATVGRGIAGGIALHHSPDDDPLYPGWWLLGPVVRTRYRRAGIGGELLRQALERAARGGASWVYLLAYEDDSATRSLAQAVGFLPTNLPTLQAGLDDPPWPDERRRVILACALPLHTRHP